MRVSIIIPVWNGRSVIESCLESVYKQSGSLLHELICVDNASADESATLIIENFPQVTLLRQPINLGFAGGVNVGLHAATGDLMVLLNQDCLVHAGYLEALVTAVTENPKIGVVGAQIYNEDKSINHLGAILERPLAYGTHLTNQDEYSDRTIDYVTGALFGITRTAWNSIGDFDDEFYPAYYEEVDYCLRAKLNGFDLQVVLDAKASHLFNNKEWQAKPIKHTANQHSMRYRFIAKHYSISELLAFFKAEETAVSEEVYYEQAIGRVIGIRKTLQELNATLEKRLSDLNEKTTAVHRRLLAENFNMLYQKALAHAENLSSQRDVAPPFSGDPHWRAAHEHLRQLQQQEYDTLSRIYFRAPNEQQPESKWHRLYRLLLLRPLSFITLRDYFLQSKLNTIHVARIDQLQKLQRITERRLTLLEDLHEQDHA